MKMDADELIQEVREIMEYADQLAAARRAAAVTGAGSTS